LYISGRSNGTQKTNDKSVYFATGSNGEIITKIRHSYGMLFGTLGEKWVITILPIAPSKTVLEAVRLWLNIQVKAKFQRFIEGGSICFLFPKM